jgi:hypothetical protein
MNWKIAIWNKAILLPRRFFELVVLLDSLENLRSKEKNRGCIAILLRLAEKYKSEKLRLNER